MQDQTEASQWLRAQLTGVPLALLEPYLENLAASGFQLPAAGADASQFTASRFSGSYDWQNHYTVTDDGICIIPVHGVLIDRGAWLSSYWRLTTYEGLGEQFRRAADDDEIKQVLLDLNSPGGAVAGLYDLVETLKSLTERKPVTALANSMACSAAYAIGCVADTLCVNRTGTVGSIGIIAKFDDYSGMNQRLGIKRTTIRYGAFKQAGSGDEPLSAEAHAMFQAECDRQGDTFVAHVAAHRGLEWQAVRETEARCYIGQAGVEIGLADDVVSFEECLARMRVQAARPRASSRKRGISTMTGNTTGTGHQQRMSLDDETIGRIVQGLQAQAAPAAPQPPQQSSVSEDQLRAAVADAGQEGGQQAVDRIKAILTSDKAAGNEKMAMKLAFERAELSAEAAIDLLATMPAEKSEANTEQHANNSFSGGLNAAMQQGGNSARITPDPKGGSGGGMQAADAGDFFKKRIEKKYGGARKKLF